METESNAQEAVRLLQELEASRGIQKAQRKLAKKEVEALRFIIACGKYAESLANDLDLERRAEVLKHPLTFFFTSPHGEPTPARPHEYTDEGVPRMLQRIGNKMQGWRYAIKRAEAVCVFTSEEIAAKAARYKELTGQEFV